MRAVACVLVAVGAACWAADGRRDQPPRSGPKPSSITPQKVAPLAAVSCAAAGCHGGPGDRLGGEHTTWSPGVTSDEPDDPHARAYRILFNADSVRIAERFGGGPAHKNTLCLKCHAIEGAEPTAVAEGVGCAGCHGPAEKWLAAHYQPGWQALTNREKAEHYGFRPTKNLVSRLLACAGCHIGDARREVNHDLIAAGHPRLAFEYTRFHYQPQYRKHWRERTPDRDFEVRAWVLGHAVGLRAATDLLRARAERVAHDDEHTPWPEFAGYSCYACHQTVGMGEVRGELSAATRAPGSLAWELWSTGTVEVVARFAGRVFPGAGPIPLGELAALRKTMAVRTPNPETVSHQATALVADLDRWLAAVQAAEDRGDLSPVPRELPAELARALADHALADGGKKVADADWDVLAMHYLGCAAMFHASRDRGPEPPWRDPLVGIARELRFPAGTIGGPVKRFDSPAGFDLKKLERVRDGFRRIRDAAGVPGGGG